MLDDAQNKYSDFQALTATAASTNVLQKKGGVQGVGAGGRTIWLVVQIVESFNNLTNIAFAWQTDTVVGFGSAVALDSRTITLASSGLNQGGGYTVAANAGSLKEFTRMNYTLTGTTPTTGKVSAFLVEQVDAFNYVSLP